jgi:RNA polymerase sigma-70 factor (ECF subfamily)
MCSTSPTLLERVKDAQDHEAWGRFHSLYAPLLRDWIRWFGVPPAAVEDLVQDSLIRAARKMPTFSYNPEKSFRGWLRTVVRNQVLSFYRARSNRPPHMPLPPGLDPGADPGEEAWEADYRRHLLETLLKQVREQVDDEVWLAFDACHLRCLPRGQAARELGITYATLIGRAWKVMRLLREAGRGLDRDLWPNP